MLLNSICLCILVNYFSPYASTNEEVARDPYRNLPKVLFFSDKVKSSEHSKYLTDMLMEEFFKNTDIRTDYQSFSKVRLAFWYGLGKFSVNSCTFKTRNHRLN